jgi:hypothetical protein
MAMISSPNIVGPRTSIAASRTTSSFDAPQPADAVLHHDHRAVDDEAEVDRPEAHQARRNPRGPHQVGGEEHRQRDRQGHDQAGPDVAEEHEQHADHEQPPLGEVVEHRVERPADQVAAVVDDLQFDAGRKRAADLAQLLFGGGHDPPAVLAADHHHHPGHHLAAAVAGRRPLPHERGHGHGADVSDEHRHAPRRAADDDLLDVGHALEQRLAADEPLLAMLDDIAAAGAGVVALQRPEHLAEGDAMGRHPVGIDLHLVALGEAAVAVDVGDAGHGPHRRRDVPLEDAAQVHQAPPLPADLELEDLAEGRAQGAELRRGVGERDRGLGSREPLLDELPGTEDVGPLPEDDRDQRDAEPGDAPDLLDGGQAADRELDGIGDRPLDLQRRQRAGLGHHLHLHVDEVGDGVDGDLRGGEQPAHGEEHEQRDDERPVGERPLDDA